MVYLSNPKGVSEKSRRQLIDSMQELNRRQLGIIGDPDIATHIENYELAFRMQTSVPELMDIAKEPKHVLEAYGPGEQARSLLLARRLVERGVRFVQVSHGPVQPWDSHDDLEKEHRRLAGQVDKPIAALIADLKRLGLFDSTAV